MENKPLVSYAQKKSPTKQSHRVDIYSVGNASSNPQKSSHNALTAGTNACQAGLFSLKTIEIV
jgi:hypothetical protein